MQEYKIISALIGLIGACETNLKTPNTDFLIIKALSIPLSESHCTNSPSIQTLSQENIIQEIYTEKNTIAPNCAQCTSPCGNTSDYDMQKIFQAEEPIRNVKLQILSELHSLASYLYLYHLQNCSNPNLNLQNLQNLKFERAVPFFYKALSFIRSDREEAVFLNILKEAQQLRKEIEHV